MINQLDEEMDELLDKTAELQRCLQNAVGSASETQLQKLYAIREKIQEAINSLRNATNDVVFESDKIN